MVSHDSPLPNHNPTANYTRPSASHELPISPSCAIPCGNRTDHHSSPPHHRPPRDPVLLFVEFERENLVASFNTVGSLTLSVCTTAFLGRLALRGGLVLAKLSAQGSEPGELIRCAARLPALARGLARDLDTRAGLAGGFSLLSAPSRREQDRGQKGDRWQEDLRRAGHRGPPLWRG